jgi:hypothetical protein
MIDTILAKLRCFSAFAVVAFSLMGCQLRSGDYGKSNMAYIALQAELQQINRSIGQYSTLSKTGAYYLRIDSILQQRTAVMKVRLRLSPSVSIEEQHRFFDFFRKAFHNSYSIDFQKFDILKNTPISSVADIDLITLYLKSCIVSILNENKILPFNMMSFVAYVNSDKVKYGDEVEINMAIGAAYSESPTEWYLVKSASGGLTKGNIIDTLRSDAFGGAAFRTRKYKMGENKLGFMCRFYSPSKDNILAREVTFDVK